MNNEISKEQAWAAAKKLEDDKKYWVDMQFKQPDPSDVLLTPDQGWAYIMDKEFKEKVDNLTQKEIEKWNKESLEWQESLYE